MSREYVPTERQRQLAREIYAATGKMPRFPAQSRPPKPETLEEFVAQLPVDERRAMAAALGYARGAESLSFEEVEQLLAAQVKARWRTESRRHSDRATDRQRRCTIGTRQPRSFYDECAAAAANEGKSVNAWVYGVLRAWLDRHPMGRPSYEVGETPWLLL